MTIYIHKKENHNVFLTAQTYNLIYRELEKREYNV